MPKDKNKENVRPRVRFAQVGRKPGSTVNAPATITTAPPALTAPNVPIASNTAAASTTFVPASQPALPTSVAQNANIRIIHQHPIVQNGTITFSHCMGEFCESCNLQAQVNTSSNTATTQPRTTAGPPPPNPSNPYTVRPVVPLQQGQTQPQPQPQTQVSLLQLLQARVQPQPQPRPQTQPSQPYLVPGVPISSLYAAPVIGAPNQPTSDAKRLSPLAFWPLRHPPALLSNKHNSELPLLEMIDYFDGPAGIWPPTVQRRPESGLFNKVIGHPHAQTPLLDIELCQISTSKVGGQGQDGLRWAVLLLPDMNSKGLVDPELDPIIHLPSLDRQCAWLLDPYARMEGREFFQFLDPETLMLRRKLHLQSLVKISCEHMLDTEKLMRKMEGNEEWKDAICCSVTGVADPRSLALGTGLWATALSQVAYGDLRETSPTIMLMRSIIGTELESIGSRQLGLPFLYPGRLNNPSQAAD